MSLATIRNFLRLESASGIILIVIAVIAMVIANSPLDGTYESLLNTYGEIRVGDFEIAKPILLWINDGLMAIFFLLIGLEVKREIREGQLSTPAQVALPGLAALGGLVVPVLIYAALNWGDSEAMNGWAIPAATDIAFALGVLYLLGDRVPTSLKLFLMTIAIFDDLAAITIIAVFYTGDLSLLALGLAGVSLVTLAIMNRAGVTDLRAYGLLGVLLWILVLKSGVHATLAGVALAFTIPMRDQAGKSPVKELEHSLHPYVAYAILPLFALANAGVSLSGMALDTLFEPVPLGILAGLFVGKQIGIFGATWLAVKAGLARLPTGARWIDIYGVAVLGGIGFTMGLFIGSLAFEHGAEGYIALDRLGILVGSLLSMVWGYGVLRIAPSRPITREVRAFVPEGTD
jgi:NhaA family Na+:H+ antiporter